jgi:hypothetical protein
MKSVSVPAVAVLRSSLSMYVCFVYSTIFSHCFVNSSPDVSFQTPLIYCGVYWCKLQHVCLSLGAAGCVATLLHDAIMNPAEGMLFAYHALSCGPQTETHFIISISM